MNYSPLPGTVAHKAVLWLQHNAPKGEVQNSELAKAIGADPNSMSGCLGKAIKQGWVKRKYAGPGFRSFWSLGPAASVLAEVKPAPVAKPLRPAGYYTEAMRQHNWPPGYQPHFEMQRAQGAARMRVVELAGAAA